MSENSEQSSDQFACCRLCGSELSQPFLDLGLVPLANSYRKSSELKQMEPFYPLCVYVCSRCYLVQVPECESPEHIFTNYAYFSSYSDTWVQHAKDYCERMIDRFGLNESQHVVEIGSNDGYLLQHFVSRAIPVLGIEPAVNVGEVASKRGIPTIAKFFTKETARELVTMGIEADLVVGNNVFGHVPQLNDFVEGMQILLKPHGVITLEFPHLMRLIAERQFDTIYHEHFSYFSLNTAERVLRAHGLDVFDVEEIPTHGGSLRIYIRHTGDTSKPESERVWEMRAREKAAGLADIECYHSFAEAVKETKRKLLDFVISAKRKDKTLTGYGAPAKATILLNYCGIRSDFIDYTVDRSPYKQGHFVPGTHIPILHPSRINETKPDYLLILPWNLKDEIMKRMACIRQWGGQFVVPIPEATVYP